MKAEAVSEALHHLQQIFCTKVQKKYMPKLKTDIFNYLYPQQAFSCPSLQLQLRTFKNKGVELRTTGFQLHLIRPELVLEEHQMYSTIKE